MRLGLTRLARRLTGITVVVNSASVLTRTSAVTAYPPTISFTRPIDWQDGDLAVMQWSTDSTFATGVTETTTPVTLTAAVLTYNFGLSAIVAGIYYMRLGAWRGTRPGSLNWSNLQGVGDAVAPTITSAAATTGTQGFAGTFALTANKAATWAIVGGVDGAQFSISGSTLSWLAQSGTPTLNVQVQATSLFGIGSTVQTITDTIAANTPLAFSFTPVTGATQSTLYTSNTVTISGIGVGAVNGTITGGNYSKNGGAYTNANFTAVNGDTFALQETSSAAYSTGVNAVLTIGATAGTYTVTTMANPASVFSMTQTAAPATQNVAFAGLTTTFTAVALGAADATRKMLIAVYSNGGGAVTAVTVAGISATAVGAANGNISLWSASVPTGTSGNVVATTAANVNTCGITATSIIASTTGPTVTTLAFGFNASPQAVSVTTPTGGAAYVVLEAPLAGTAAWTNATGQSQNSQFNETLAAAIRSTAGAATISVTGFGNANTALIAASYGP